MEYTPVSSFRRPINSVQLKHHSQASQPGTTAVSKWDALRCLATARQHYNLSDRDLTVLQAMLGFHPETELGGESPSAIVYPSNKTICERLNGMPCSTMRRHLARLVDTGVIIRRDSPNGKRYVRRTGSEKIAFGFDLSPLAARYAEFSRIAQEIEEAEARRKRLRDTVSLMRRDLAGFVDYGMTSLPNLPLWDRLSDLARLTARDLRRKLSLKDLASLETKLRTALEKITVCLESSSTDLSTSGAQIEQHHQKSNKEYIDKKEKEPHLKEAIETNDQNQNEPPPLRMVLDTCKEIQAFSQSAVRNWDDLVRLSDIVSPMMGIANSIWREAQLKMGRAQAATVLAAMLERFSEIKSPAAYLRALGRKSEHGAFSSGAMIRALDRKLA